METTAYGDVNAPDGETKGSDVPPVSGAGTDECVVLPIDLTSGHAWIMKGYCYGALTFATRSSLPLWVDPEIQPTVVILGVEYFVINCHQIKLWNPNGGSTDEMIVDPGSGDVMKSGQKGNIGGGYKFKKTSGNMKRKQSNVIIVAIGTLAIAGVFTWLSSKSCADTETHRAAENAAISGREDRDPVNVVSESAADPPAGSQVAENLQTSSIEGPVSVQPKPWDRPSLFDDGFFDVALDCFLDILDHIDAMRDQANVDLVKGPDRKYTPTKLRADGQLGIFSYHESLQGGDHKLYLENDGFKIQMRWMKRKSTIADDPDLLTVCVVNAGAAGGVASAREIRIEKVDGEFRLSRWRLDDQLSRYEHDAFQFTRIPDEGPETMDGIRVYSGNQKGLDVDADRLNRIFESGPDRRFAQRF